MAGGAGRLHRAGPVVARSQDERLSVLLPGLFSDLVARQRLPGSPPHRPCLGAPSVRQGKPCLLLLPFPSPSPAASIPRAPCASWKTRGRQLFPVEFASQ